MSRKIATFHINCIHGQPVDFELYENGEIVVVGIDIDTELSLVELGFPATECVTQYVTMRDSFLSFVKRTLLSSGIFANTSLYLNVSTSHIKRDDDEILMKKSSPMREEGLSIASCLFFEPTEYGYRFYLDPAVSPKRLVSMCSNEDGLSNELISVLQRAWDAGVWQVQFDGDADKLEGAETFDW